MATRQTQPPVSTRIGNRRKVSVPARLTWRDTSGTLRFVSVMTRDVSDVDAFVECQVPASIPLYRLVHFQVERRRASGELPAVLQRGQGAVGRLPRGPIQDRRRERRRATRCVCWSSRSQPASASARRRRSARPSRTRDSQASLLPPVAREPEPELLERRGDDVGRDLRLGHLPPQPAAAARQTRAPFLVRSRPHSERQRDTQPSSPGSPAASPGAAERS